MTHFLTTTKFENIEAERKPRKKSCRVYEKEDLSGQKFNMLTYLRISHVGKDKREYWIFKCECGNQKIIRKSKVKYGETKSCGCLNGNFKHGMRDTPTYRSWSNMRTRCLNPNSNRYKIYGERGIKVCDRWLNSFENFLLDMGKRPKNTSLDRIDNNLGYSKENCRWATNLEQMNNTSKNKLITYLGETQSMMNWSRELGFDYKLIASRLSSGWSFEASIKNTKWERYK